MAVQIVLGIPGTWPDRSSIVRAVAAQSGGWALVGDWLLSNDSHSVCEVDIRPYDDRLARSFAYAGRGALSDDDLAAIAAHTYTVYLISETATVEGAREAQLAGVALLDAGGLAVKVESAGVAHSAGAWRELAAQDDPGALYSAYVTLVRHADKLYSCGMHQLGQRDAETTVEGDVDVAAQVLVTFLLYTLLERPTLKAGETFSVDEESGSPVYRLRVVPCVEYPLGDLFYNPDGLWHLTPEATDVVLDGKRSRDQ